MRTRTLAGLGLVAALCGALIVSLARPAAGAATGGCPVTLHGSGKKAPLAFVQTGLPVPYVHTWLASKTIWLRLPRHGIIPATPDPDGQTISAKFPWWRVVRGQLHAWAHPVGQTQPRLAAQVQSVAYYGPTGFVPSGLRFSGPGCWRITGSLRGHTISFVAQVTVSTP